MKSYNLGAFMHFLRKRRHLKPLNADFGYRGRYESKSMVLGLFLMIILGFGSVEMLGQEMKDTYLRQLCDLNSSPDQSTFNRYLKEIDYQKMREQNRLLVKRIRRRHKINIYALDSSYLEVFGKLYSYVGRVYSYISKRKIKGYKLISVVDVFTGMTVAWIFVQCNLHENSYLKQIIDYMIKEDMKPDIILIDKGFYDHTHFKWLTKKHITYICPMKEYSTNLKQIECYSFDEDKKSEKKVIADLKIKISGMTKKQRAIIIQNGTRKYTLLTNGFGLDQKKVVEYYSMRWNVENFFKVLKNDWNIRKFPTTDYDGLRFYVELVLYAYNVHICYRMHTGKNMGIKQMRMKEFEVVVLNVIPEPKSVIDVLSIVKTFFSKKIKFFLGS